MIREVYGIIIISSYRHTENDVIIAAHRNLCHYHPPGREGIDHRGSKGDRGDLTIFPELARSCWLQSSGDEPGNFCISRRYPSFNHTVAHDRLCNCQRTTTVGYSEEAPGPSTTIR